jgi:DNA invertase Pin-like site-specific DNA recombinase
MIVSAYCRVSTDSKDQLKSLENQISYFNREIKSKGNTLYKIYYDEGLTGTKLNNRPDFEKMLYDAGIDVKIFKSDKRDLRIKHKHTVYELSDRTPLFDEIWIKNTSRFARNTLSYEIISLLRQKHVNIFFMEQNINSNDMAQDMLLKLMQIFDEQDSKDKSLKVRTGIRESAKRGRIRTNDQFYGYHYIQTENRLEIIPEEAEIVKTIFELYANGKGYRQIINYLTEHQIYTRKGKPFVPIVIRRMLDNEKYFGYNNPIKIDQGEVFQKKYAQSRENYDIFKTDKIPPIITKELFDKCKEVASSRIDIYSKKGVYKGLSKYSELIYCGNCNQIYYSNTIKQHDGTNKQLYNCSTKKKKGKSVCSNPNVYQCQIDEFIHSLATGELNYIITMKKKDAENIIFNIIDNKIKSMNNDNKNEVISITSKINEQQNILNGYYELYARQNVSSTIKDSLLNKIESTESIIEQYSHKSEELNKDNDTIKEEISQLLKRIESINSIYSKQLYSDEEVIDLLEKLIIEKDGGIVPVIKNISTIDDLKSKYLTKVKIKKFTSQEISDIIRIIQEL